LIGKTEKDSAFRIEYRKEKSDKTAFDNVEKADSDPV
jgi:hypothetical protein